MRRYFPETTLLFVLCSLVKTATAAPQIAVRDLTGPDTKACTQVTLAIRGLLGKSSGEEGVTAYHLEGACMGLEKHLLINVRVVDRAGATVSGTTESLLCEEEEMTGVLERLAARLAAAVVNHQRSRSASERTPEGNAYRSTRATGMGWGSRAAGASAAATANRAATMEAHKRPQYVSGK